MDLELLFLGTAGAAPTARRGLPAFLLTRGGDQMLFDCGEGTQRQLLQSSGLVDLPEVFLTHFHADHILGLPGLLKSFALRGREAPMAIHGPPGLKKLWTDAIGPLVGRLPYPFELNELEPAQPVERDGYVIAPFPVEHRGLAYGYAIVEEDRLGRFDEAVALELGVQPGPDFGRLHRGEAVPGKDGPVTPEQVVGESRPGRKVVLAGDCRPSESTKVAAHGAELLVHEATLLQDELARAKETGHSTAREAAELALAAEVKMLALTHVSPRYGGGELKDEAREVFPEAIVPRDFDRIVIPFAERGTPEHIRADD
ncbi:MAG: ribonuclease [Thermoleophilaceae bacterium]|jgi:ribonuclease Z|nr:ribonuclease [Thermoleophilaceae bacterium]